MLLYDKSGEEHYNLISALHKSVRNSDPDAALVLAGSHARSGRRSALHRAARGADGGRRHRARRAERAVVCMAARDAVDFIGMPEGNLALAQAVVYLAIAPKSNALYTAYGAVQADVERTAAEPVPLHIRNAPTGLMKRPWLRQGLSVCPRSRKQSRRHAVPSGQFEGPVYYHPTNEGVEKRIRERIEEIREEANQETGSRRLTQTSIA